MKNKRALVCGSSQGIGASTAMELSKRGTSIVLLARDEAALKMIFNQLDTSLNQEHSYVVADFDEPNNLKKKIDGLLNDSATIHILVNNSGGPMPAPILESTSEDFINAFSSDQLKV